MNKCGRLVLCGILFFPALFSCQRKFAPTSVSEPLYRVSVAVEDPQEERRDSYERIARQNRYGFLLECAFDHPCWKNISSRQDLPLPEDWQKLTDWNFDRYKYDLVVIAVPDPAHYAELVGNTWKKGNRVLEFGIFADRSRGAVPTVIVSENFLFRYPKRTN